MGAFALTKNRLLGAVILAIAIWVLPGTSFAYTADEEQACTGDAFRLCSSAIPDVARVTACMERRQHELSPGCRVYFRSERPVAEAAKPTKSRKVRKARKRKS